MRWLRRPLSLDTGRACKTFQIDLPVIIYNS